MKKLLLLSIFAIGCEDRPKEKPKVINQDSIRIYKAERLMDSTFLIIDKKIGLK